MHIPDNVLAPPFNITRASHAVWSVRDLDASEAFYTQVLGLVVTAREGERLYLRGIEEVCHHSLVLVQRDGAATCDRIGLRVYTEDDLDMAKAWFSARGLACAFVEVPHQGRTLQVNDPLGTAMEFCATMPLAPRQLTQFHTHLGGCAQRFDHYQILLPDIEVASEFYIGMGFRLSEYMVDASEKLMAIFVQRKGNPHDIAIMYGRGPRIHHVAYTTVDVHTLIRACDVAGSLGFGRSVERGPQRHGPGHALFVYFRDPDGHRIELFNTHYLTLDIENKPARWDPSNMHRNLPWGLPAQRSWYEEATAFTDVDVREPAVKPNPMTLERYLAERA
jgi:catechol 2,3-dioxygenase